MGLDVKPPEATFYLWVDCTLQVGYLIIVVSKLPDEIHTGLAFFEACLEEKVIVVPGMLSPSPTFQFSINLVRTFL
jgi:aspartate/methionine/tyrosine aminotransferase